MTSPACTSCGATLTAGAKFCSECGTPSAQRCPSCGNPAIGRYCAECGTPLAAVSALPVQAQPAPPAAESAPVAERRIVSLLFADLVGFTGLSESRDPEEVRELLSSYFERARAVVERYGGTVEKFIGDAVFAVWGVPAAREDDAERAVRAGLDLTSTINALGEELGVDGLAMRVGITTGQVAVTLGAVGEGMVAGDAVNTASRVQSVANPGQVWVDDTTRSLTTASLAYAAMGSFDLKGKSVPVALFHAVRTTGVVGGEQRVDGLEAPFVGRDRDLRLVKELFHATVEESRPRLLLISGEPGIGKSRLAWEFEKYVDAIPTQISYWMRARCLSYGEGIAGRVIAELIRYLLRLTESDDDETASRVLHERLEQHVPDPADRAVLGPRLESLLGLTDTSFEQADLFACWRAFLESLHLDGSSVTMVIEDLQWADDGLFDFLDHVLEAGRAPIFIVGLARPEVTANRPGLGAGRRSTTLFLEPLTPPAMSTLLDGLVEQLPSRLRDELVNRAEGVPLYGVETIRALIDRDIVVPREGRYSVDAEAAESLDLDALGPPASLQSLLSARLDALPDTERRVVQDASVLGMSFTAEGIRALVPADIDLDGVLESLRHKEILTVESDPRSPERGQFRFVQALLRTVAYETLSRRDRQSRHLAAAEFLAKQADEAMTAVIAEHYLDAYSAIPESPDAGSMLAQAQQLFERAAEHALNVGAARSAVALFDRLLDLSPPDDTVIRVTLRRDPLARRLGVSEAASSSRIEVALPLAEAAGREREVLYLRLARATNRVQSEPQSALSELQDIFDRALEEPELTHLLAETLHSVCLCSQSLGDVDIARVATQRSLDSIERYGDEAAFATYLQAMSMHYGLAGYLRLSSLMRRSVAPLFDERDPRGIAAMLNLATTLSCDRPVEANEAILEGRRREEALGLPGAPVQAVTVANAVVLGTPESVQLARAVIERSRNDGQGSLRDWEAGLAAGSALLARLLGDPELVLPAVDSEQASADPVSNGWWLMREAVVADFAGDVEPAADLAVSAVERMAELGLSHEDMPLAYGLAVDLLRKAGHAQRLAEITTPLESLSVGQRFRLLAGLIDVARAAIGDDPVPGLRRAIDVFDAMKAGFRSATTRVDLAEQLLAAGEPGEAAAVLEAAEPMLTALNATPALERLAASRAQLATQPAAL